MSGSKAGAQPCDDVEMEASSPKGISNHQKCHIYMIGVCEDVISSLQDESSHLLVWMYRLQASEGGATMIECSASGV